MQHSASDGVGPSACTVGRGWAGHTFATLGATLYIYNDPNKHKWNLRNSRVQIGVVQMEGLRTNGLECKGLLRGTREWRW